MKAASISKSLRSVAGALALLAASVSMSGCDWIFSAFMNSIPVKGNPSHNPEVNVYLGIDGLSYYTVAEAMKHGAFQGPDWKLAKFISMFPATSDVAWTRLLHTQKIGGYEIEYYDYAKDSIVNPGIEGLAKHVAPPIFPFIDFEPEYLKSFNYRANGYFHSAEAYSNTFTSMGQTFDSLFSMLDGQVETAKAFSAYLLEFDVLGHMRSKEDTVRKLLNLSRRIEKFRAGHSNRKITFTLFSDHGMDFIPVGGDGLVVLKDHLKDAGIEPVETLAGRENSPQPVAIPVMHTRVSYIALHTLPQMIEEVAGRVSSISSVDLAVSKLRESPVKGELSSKNLEWYGIWSEGKLAVGYGFDPKEDLYYLPAGQAYSRIKVEIDFQGKEFMAMTDDKLFQLTKDGQYPDIFYRTRTSLVPIAMNNPADVIVSFRQGFVSKGFSLGGKDDIASAGFHGAMDQLGSLGTLLTNERDLPDAVRSDTFFELFPKMRAHIRTLGLSYVEGDPNASLNYQY